MPPEPRQYVVELSGTPGAEYVGTISVDGEMHKIKGTLPDRFGYEAFHINFAFALARQNEGHKISAETTANGKVIARHYEFETGVNQEFKCFGYSEGAFGGCSGHAGMLPDKFVKPLLKENKLPPSFF